MMLTPSFASHVLLTSKMIFTATKSKAEGYKAKASTAAFDHRLSLFEIVP